MKAGRLKHRLKLMKPTVRVDRYGAKAADYVLERTVAAERVKHTGRQVTEAGEQFSDYSVQYNIRDAHPVSEGWRVQELGGHLYTVTNIIPNLDRGFNTLCCERVNE